MLVFYVIALLFIHQAFSSDVIELNETNFEHLTQSTTGATTGDWLIEYYAPWCGHCKKLAPIWEEVATKLKGKVNVAKVDVTSNRALGQRFGIRGFPTILLLKRGKMIKYEGKRTLDDITQWTLSINPTDEIPKPSSFFDNLLAKMLQSVEDIVVLFEQKLVATIILLLIGSAFGFIIGTLFATPSLPKSSIKTSISNNIQRSDNTDSNSNNNKNDSNTTSTTTNNNNNNNTIEEEDEDDEEEEEGENDKEKDSQSKKNE